MSAPATSVSVLVLVGLTRAAPLTGATGGTVGRRRWQGELRLAEVIEPGSLIERRSTSLMPVPPHEEASPASSVSRRSLLKGSAAAVLAAGTATPLTAQDEMASSNHARPWLRIRGIYGGFPRQILQRGETPADYGINAIWVGSGRLDASEIDRYHRLGLKVFAEFNSMHSAAYLKEHPDAAPIGPDGKPSPPPHGWQTSPCPSGTRPYRLSPSGRPWG